ncbi:MAG: caspase family protein [Bacteroidales bacterium]|nr:caspase family protein [Bacteroidales bacterium]
MISVPHTPLNDAKAMANVLHRTGFDVLEYLNVQNLTDMKREVREFDMKIQNGGVGLFTMPDMRIRWKGITTGS